MTDPAQCDNFTQKGPETLSESYRDDYTDYYLIGENGNGPIAYIREIMIYQGSGATEQQFRFGVDDNTNCC